MTLSIVIPTYNEAEGIATTIQKLQTNLAGKQYEIIISDGGSTDNTVAIATKMGVKILVSPHKGRAGQMNFGASQAIGNTYFFLHADCVPTPDFYDLIVKTISHGYNCGSFRTKFDRSSVLLKINAFFTRFNFLFFRGGDQGIFVTKELWGMVGTFKEDMFIMEDYDYIARLWQQGIFKLIPNATVVSARKYDENSWLTVQLANLKIVSMYKKGAPQKEMVAMYKQLLSYRKNAF